MNRSVNIELIIKHVFDNIYTYSTIVWVLVNDTIVCTEITSFRPKRNQLNKYLNNDNLR